MKQSVVRETHNDWWVLGQCGVDGRSRNPINIIFGNVPSLPGSVKRHNYLNGKLTVSAFQQPDIFQSL